MAFGCASDPRCLAIADVWLSLSPVPREQGSRGTAERQARAQDYVVPPPPSYMASADFSCALRARTSAAFLGSVGTRPMVAVSLGLGDALPYRSSIRSRSNAAIPLSIVSLSLGGGAGVNFRAVGQRLYRCRRRPAGWRLDGEATGARGEPQEVHLSRCFRQDLYPSLGQRLDFPTQGSNLGQHDVLLAMKRCPRD